MLLTLMFYDGISVHVIIRKLLQHPGVQWLCSVQQGWTRLPVLADSNLSCEAKRCKL